MSSLSWSGNARRDLLNQFLWIARDNPTAAWAMRDRLEKAVTVLLRFPDTGRPGRLRGTRELVISGTPYVAVYRAARGRVTILRLLHARQQWPRGDEP